MASYSDIASTGTPTEKGYLGYYSLLNWWESEFNKEEQHYIIAKYKPMGSAELINGTLLGSSASVINFLTGLQTWFTTLADEVISGKILRKAETLITERTPILDIHFLYGFFIEHYYKKRNIENVFYELAKTYCEKQINISQKVKDTFISEGFPILPRHKGFEQLAIILEKEKKYIEALDICNKGKEMGWNTDWNKRIFVLRKKINK